MVTIKFLAAKLLLSILVTSAVEPASISDFWKLMDTGYDTSYLEPVEELFPDSALACASESLLRNVTAFGYHGDEDLCILLNVDYYVEHDWTPLPDMDVFLRNEDIHPGPCLESSCGFCMPVLENPMTWADAGAACGDISSYLLEIWSDWEHRCIVMQLQYLRKPTTNVYWLGGPGISEWVTESGAGQIPEAGVLLGPGQPNNSEQCVLLDAGDHYRLFTADCSEQHYALCYYDVGGFV
ncbi:uncharacterized protein LOC124117721 [Haliotis rufescens]|uniref:uncharacterized protein LOC124117721 n=1 Tax=Haliotis rufescens TaxID=6454 RepID=UPI00201F9A51|nr:uncharacterized protein LOC124117721 [Haliotis rufescens]